MSLDITLKVSKDDIIRLQPHLRGWLKTQAYIKMLPSDEKSLLELRKMISIEVTNNKRLMIVLRLKEKFNSIRRELEDKLLFAKLPEYMTEVKKKTVKRYKQPKVGEQQTLPLESEQ